MAWSGHHLIIFGFLPQNSKTMTVAVSASVRQTSRASGRGPCPWPTSPAGTDGSAWRSWPTPRPPRSTPSSPTPSNPVPPSSPMHGRVTGASSGSVTLPCSQRAARARGDDPGELLPGVHRIASLAKRWLLGTHQGSVDEAHLQSYLNEFAFRFNRRRSSSRWHSQCLGEEPGRRRGSRWSVRSVWMVPTSTRPVRWCS
ncbi:MAG: transposase [Pseudonocardiaceae bacterium]